MGGEVGYVDLLQHPATQALADKAGTECNARYPLSANKAKPTVDAAAYQRMLQTRECLIAHGYAIPDPPSEVAWIDAGMYGAWNPYVEFIGSGAQYKIPEATLFALDAACPQPGVNDQVQVPSEAYANGNG